MLQIALAIAFLGVAVGPVPAAASDTGDAVLTPGKGTMTMCRNWIVYRACRPYYNVAVPRRIAVGDRIRLTFGSNPKDYVFHVVEIRPKGDGCLILSDESRGAEDRERLEIASCQPGNGR